MGTTKQNFDILAIIKVNKHQSTTIPFSSSGENAVDLFLPPPPFFICFDTVKLMFKTSVLESLYRGQQSGHFQVPKNSHFQNVAKRKTLLVKMSFIRMRIKKKKNFISMASHLASL